MATHGCLLTGAANTLANCTAQIADFAAGTSINSAWCPPHPTNGARDCTRSEFTTQKGDLYNSDGSPNQLNVVPSYTALAEKIQFA